jgi:hypothetical protein
VDGASKDRPPSTDYRLQEETMDGLSSILTAFGLSTSAGLNAYIPLLVVALLARFTDLIKLNAPWDVMESPWVIGALSVLLAIEVLVDKIPAVDTINDTIQTFVRPAAGAVLFAASNNVISDVNPALAFICGLLISGGVHAAKATARPIVTATTAGVGNPVVSTLEDILSGAMSILAVVMPIVLGIFLLLLALLIGWWLTRRRARPAAGPRP